MSGTQTHNADQVKVKFAGITISEKGKDEFVRIKRNSPAYTMTKSVDGKATVREATNDNSAKIEVVILATSPSNAFLTAILLADRAAPNGAGIAPLSILDLNSDGGAELHFAAEAYIEAEPEVTYARGVGERVWTFATGDLKSVHAGH